MGLHHRHTHGRVFRGLEAREQLEIQKRDSHGDHIKMNVPAGFVEKDVQTAVSVVYVTLPQTFSGDAVYVTMSGNPSAAAPASTQAAVTSAANNGAASSVAAVKSSAQAGNQVSSGNAATSVAMATSQAHGVSESAMTTFATATASLSSTALTASMANNQNSVLVGSPLQATQSATATSNADTSSQSGNGMSGGASAGLAFGIIAAIALAAGLIFFCWRRNKTRNHQEINDEKHASFVDAGARRFEASGGMRNSVMTEKVPESLRSTRTASTAPRLSLRPVTQFLPNLGENRKSSGNALDVATAGGLAVAEKPKSAWERRPSNSAQNPFDDAPAISEKQMRPESSPSNPFDEAEGKKSTESASAAAAASAKHSPKSSWEGTEPPTPKSTKFGTAAAVPVAAGAVKDVSQPRGPNNVHRVQLDFKPSMDDELELRSGQLVRMLHEYDDGWALCIRMDRSQQGVAPRTCLSKTPVRPRPQGPPGSRPGPPPQGPPASRPGPPPQGARRPSNASPPQAPALNGPMFPRPLTPGQSSQASSPTSSNGDGQPAGMPARKPVPGQAM